MQPPVGVRIMISAAIPSASFADPGHLPQHSCGVIPLHMLYVLGGLASQSGEVPDSIPNCWEGPSSNFCENVLGHQARNPLSGGRDTQHVNRIFAQLSKLQKRIAEYRLFTPMGWKGENGQATEVFSKSNKKKALA